MKETRSIADQYNKPLIPLTSYELYNLGNFEIPGGFLDQESYELTFGIPVQFNADAVFLGGFEFPGAGLVDISLHVLPQPMGTTIRNIRTNSCPVDQIL